MSWSGDQKEQAQISPNTLEERNRVIERYWPLIGHIAEKLIKRLPASVSLDDLKMAGVIGLIDAVEKYSSDKGSSFHAYIEIRIRGAMIDELRSLDWVPRTVRKQMGNLDSVRQKLGDRLGREPTEDELAEELELTTEQFHHMRLKAHAQNLLSYDDAEIQGRRRSLLESIADPNAATPEFWSEKNNLTAVIFQALNRLPERERLVLSLYYFEDLNLKEIGSMLGVTESRVSQIRAKALSDLRPIVTEMMNR